MFSKPVPKISGLPEPMTVTQLLADTTIVKPQFVIHDLLHMGTIGLVAGVSKAGKSIFGLSCAASVATGTKIMIWPTNQGKVLHINAEILPPFMQERVIDLTTRLQIQPGDNLVIWNWTGIVADLEATIENIIKMAKGQGFSLIIFDPLYKFISGKPESSASAASFILSLIRRLIKATGAAVLILHHFPKGDSKKKSPIDRLAGSGVFAREADTIITLTEHTEPDCFTVETVLRNLPEQPAFVVQRNYPVFEVREDLDPEDVEVNDDEAIETDKGLLALLKAKPLRSGEWQAAALGIGVSRPVFYRIKAKLKEEGLVTFNAVTKTWNLAGVVEVSTAETNETAETETKLLGWPSAGTVGPAGRAVA